MEKGMEGALQAQKEDGNGSHGYCCNISPLLDIKAQDCKALFCADNNNNTGTDPNMFPSPKETFCSLQSCNRCDGGCTSPAL